MRRIPAIVCILLFFSAPAARATNGNYFHVDDFAGMAAPYVPIAGNHSLWCGARAGGSLTSDGYGNDWHECFESCGFSVTANVTLSYEVRWDSEPSYDMTHVEYLNASNAWVSLPVASGVAYSGSGSASEVHVIPSSSLGPTVRFRFRFDSDGSYSDEDGNFPSTGAVTFDNVQVKNGAVVVNFEDFECESVGDKVTRSGKWAAGAHPTCSPVVACGDCVPNGDLVINTGWNQQWGNLLADGATDNEWVVRSDPDPGTTEKRPASSIATYGAWANPQANSRWISSYPAGNNNLNGHYVFEYYFCINDCEGATLDMRIRVDDEAEIFLNGNSLGTTGTLTFSANNQPVQFTTDDLYFVPGDNVLRIDVRNTLSFAMGLDVAGTIHGNTAQYHYCCTDSSCGLLGTVWLDKLNLGVQDANEPGTKGWTVNLSNGATTKTDKFGNYYFLGLVPGSYTVSLTYQGFAYATTPGSYTKTLKRGDILPDLDFGWRKGTIRDAPAKRIDPPIFAEPNPFNPETTISFILTERSQVSMKIFDVSGREIRTLANETLPPGEHKRGWDGRNQAGQSVASGVYFLRFVANGSAQTKKLMVVK